MDIAGDLDRLLEHVLAKAKPMLEEHEHFNPFGASITSGGELRSYGGSQGIPCEDPKDAYRLLRAGFQQDAAAGRLRATAMVAVATIPKELRPRHRRGIAVWLEAPGHSQRVYLPFRASKRGRLGRLGGGAPKLKYADRVATDATAYVFASD